MRRKERRDEVKLTTTNPATIEMTSGWWRETPNVRSSICKQSGAREASAACGEERGTRRGVARRGAAWRGVARCGAVVVRDERV
jgi:hypothetical protein